MMNSNSTLSHLWGNFTHLRDSLTTLNTISQPRGEAGIFSQTQPIPGQKTTNQNLIKDATHDIIQYNSVLEKLLAKYRDYVRSSVASAQRHPETDGGASVVEQKIAQLSARKDSLKKEVFAPGMIARWSY